MDLNHEITSIISGIAHEKPYSLIRTEVQRHGASRSEYAKVRRLLREWNNHFTDIKDEKNKDIIGQLISVVGGYIISKYVDVTKRSLFIERDVLNTLYEEYASDFPDIILHKIRKGEIDFPFKKYSITEGEVYEAFEYIKSFGTSTYSDNVYELGDVKFSEDFLAIWENPLLFEGRYGSFIHNDMEYTKMDFVTDYFTEQQRMNSVRIDQVPVGKSPYEIWREGHPIVRKIISEAVIKVLGGTTSVLTPKVVRDCIYESSKDADGIKESTQFKISLAVSVIKKCLSIVGVAPHEASLLDISAGWGDRLISAISLDVANYVACDPNTTLREGHRKIIDTFARGSDRYRVIYEPFESASLPPTIEYDLVFTSPPFFDLEVYTKDTNQSVATHEGPINWLVGFLFKSLEKAWKVLKVGGIMAIHITDSPSIRVCEPMVLYASWKLRGCRYMGVLGSLGGAGLVRPIWVFQKTSTSPHARKSEAALKNNHPEVYEACK